jgi:TRAP-type C4-dicarboxylate transport system substrate-binding protein
MKRVLSVLLSTAVLMFLLVTPALAKTTWNANSVWPPKNQHSIGLEAFAKKVSVATKGELELVVHAGLVPVSDMLISGVAGDEKILQIVTLPFLVRDFDELKILIDISRPYFDNVARKWGQKILYTAP